jgi:hypothetical protein
MRYRALNSSGLRMWAVTSAIAVVALARHPLPDHGVPLAAVYLVVNGFLAVRSVARDRTQIRHAADFMRGYPVRVVEPAAHWSAVLPMIAVFVGWAYFVSAASSGRFLLAYSLPVFAEAFMTRQAIARRERAGVEVFVGGGRVYAHPRMEPLP